MNDDAIPGRRYLRASHTIGLAYAAMALALVPWVVHLGFALPSHHMSMHYDLTWVGFDIVLLSSLARTAYLALRRGVRTAGPAVDGSIGTAGERSGTIGFAALVYS